MMSSLCQRHCVFDTCHQKRTRNKSLEMFQRYSERKILFYEFLSELNHLLYIADKNIDIFESETTMLETSNFMNDISIF